MEITIQKGKKIKGFNSSTWNDLVFTKDIKPYVKVIYEIGDHELHAYAQSTNKDELIDKLLEAIRLNYYLYAKDKDENLDDYGKKLKSNLLKILKEC